MKMPELILPSYQCPSTKYLERARERAEEEDGGLKPNAKVPPAQRKSLKHRDYEVVLESRLGKTQVVAPVALLSQQAGYYCSRCNCFPM